MTTTIDLIDLVFPNPSTPFPRRDLGATSAALLAVAA